jgi:hypothetical protein
MKSFILAPKLFLFYIDHMMARFFMKRLYAYVACEGVRVDFLFETV